jgi:hypothetical protein
VVHAVDAEQNNIEEAKVAQFVFFGWHDEAIVGKDAQFLSAYSVGSAKQYATRNYCLAW